MEMRKTMAKEQKAPKNENRKKISVTQIKLSDQEVGFTFQGKFKGIVMGQPFSKVDQKTGEVVTANLRLVVMEDENGERIAYVADAGLIGGLEAAMVKEGDKIEVEKLEKVKLTKGRTMNQYDIFSLS